MNTQEVIQIVRATCRRLVKARLNDCHRRLKRYKNKTQQLHDKLKQLILTELLDIVTTIADKRDNKATERARTGHQQKLTGLLRNKEQRRSKPDDNWVRNISSRPLDRNETRVLSYGQKHSVTPKRIPTKAIVSSVEAALSRQRELSESTKDNIKSRIVSTIQSALQHGSNSTKDEQHALKRRGHSYSTSRQRTSYCCHGQNWLSRQNGRTSKVTTNKPTNNSNVTRLLRFNANLTAHYWHSRRQTPLTPNATIDSGAQYHSHWNFTVCRN